MIRITVLDNAVFKVWDRLNKVFARELWNYVTLDKYKQFEKDFNDLIIQKWREYAINN